MARILGIGEARVREFVRAGLCRPTREGRRYVYSFQDLVVLRTAKELLADHVPPARVRRALAALARDLPADRPLSGVRVEAAGREVLVRDERALWQPETGQTVFDFDVGELARQVEGLRRDRDAEPAEDAAAVATDAESARADEAARWFERALDLEDEAPAAAREAYRRALALDPSLVEAWVNLGRLVHAAGNPAEALSNYRQALDLDPDDPLIHFNLGLALEDTDGVAPAIEHYERALELDPDFADAHYNLAGLCEQVERPMDALRHYHAYKKLTEG